MQEELIFGFLAPVIVFLLSLNFFVFWSRQTEARHILAFAIAFLLCSLSFLLSHNLIQGLSYPTIIVATLLDTTGLGLLIWGSCERAKVKTPHKLIIATGVIGLIAGCIATATFTSATLRFAPLNAVQTILFIACGWIWFKRAGPDQVSNHRPTGFIFFAFSLVTIILPTILHNLPNAPSAAEYQHSLNWIVYNFAIIVMATIAGLSLTSIVTDDMLKLIKNVSSTDLLTGLKTRRAFEEELEDFFIKLERSPLPLSIIIADIDHFKMVNDTYGHQTGDRVISTFGKLISQGSRKSDLVARVGGEEFCIVLWNADTAGARLVAENLRTQFQTAQFDGIPKHKKFTSSFGVAILKKGETSEELYRRADQALYHAKQNGRNRVCLDESHLEPATANKQTTADVILYSSA